MRIAVVSHHLPRQDGTAAGRALAALQTGLGMLGHDVRILAWSFGPPAHAPPAGVTCVTVDPGPSIARRLRALVHPRTDTAHHPWERHLAEVDLVIADDPISWPAVQRARRAGAHTGPTVATVHYATRLDAAAVARRSLRDVQDRRAERVVAREAPQLQAFSGRVARELGRVSRRDDVAAVPIAFDPGPPPEPMVERPEAALLANWDWPPNRVAADRLLAVWPAVRDRVPAARLRLAGRGRLEVGTLAGVEVVGAVDDSAAFLAEAAVVAFPCPPSSGPKVKVLEALAAGRPVVTSPAGLEGCAESVDVDVSPAVVRGRERGVVVVSTPVPSAWTDAIVAALRRPAERSELAAAGRSAVASVHAPAAAADARLAALVHH